MLSRGECRREIVTLHDFFVDWYTGVADRASFETFEHTLQEDFEMITPSGELLERQSVIELVETKRDRYDRGTFDIEIENVDVIEATDRLTVCRYEEHQHGPTETSARLSTALLAPSEEVGTEDPQIEWRYVHETWLDDAAGT